MLDTLRHHASSWITKALLALIILPFVVFFGYSQLTGNSDDERRYVAVVDQEGISRRAFQMHLDSSLERLREGLKGQLPENLEGFLRQNVLESLVNQELLYQYAARLGFTASDHRVATAIRSHKGLFPDGNFDLIAYEDRFLPTYRQNYGEEFEERLRRQLVAGDLEAFVSRIAAPWKEELSRSLEEIRQTKTPPRAKTGAPETVSSPITLSSEEVLSLWVNDYRDKIKVEYFQ